MNSPETFLFAINILLLGLGCMAFALAYKTFIEARIMANYKEDDEE